MNALIARLGEIDATTKTAADMIASEAAALREQRAKGTVQRAEGAAGSRSTASAVPYLQQEVEAINAQVISYEKLNSLIAERIGLERQAAAAAQNTALATSGGAAETGVATRATVAPATAATGGESLAAQLSAQEAWYAQMRRQQEALSSNRSLSSAESGGGASGGFVAGSQAEVAALNDERVNLGRTTAEWLVYDDTIAKSGGLSAAAIQGIANGTITLRELGAQVSTVVSKFAGWTAAAAGVYAVFGALTQVKDGAVEASSAVQGLTKFIPNLDRNQANNQIIQQSQQTATPISDVGQTAQQFAKVFKDQGDVFTATHVALTATKLDNIALADSYKYLTAIVQESGATAKQLPGIFDQITAAQDRLGARVSVMLPALAGSVGAVKSSGGDPSQLIGLEALTAVRSGFDGPTIANMYRQGASRYFNTAAARGIRSRLGINPDENFTQALIEAIQKGQTLTGAGQQQLATGFFGPRFGPRAAPLFRASDSQLQRYLQETQPGASKGLADTQLAKTMAQSKNQLALLKVNLGAIGAALGSSNFTNPFGVLVHLLNDALELTTKLIQAWDSLPAPVRQIGSDAAAGIGLIAASRHFNVGGILASTRFGRVPGSEIITGPLSTRPEVAAAKEQQALQDAIRKDYQAQLASTVGQGRIGAREATIAQSTGDTEAYNAAVAKQAQAAARVVAIQAELALLEEQGVEYVQARNVELAAQAKGGGAGAGGPLWLPAGAGTAEKTATLAEGEVGTSEAMGAVFGMGAMKMNMETVNSAMSSLASTVMSYAIPALIAFAAVHSMVTEGTQQQEQGVSRMENATNQNQLQAGYNEAINPSYRIPILGLHIPDPVTGIEGLISQLTGHNPLDPENKLMAAKLGLFDAQGKAMDASNRLMQSQVVPDIRKGDYKGAYQAFEKDKALGAVAPEIYQNTLQDLQAKAAPSGPGGAGVGTDPFKQWIMSATDLKNRLQPMLQSYADSIKVFGSNNSDITQLVSGYVEAVDKFGSNPQDTQAMQALAQASQSIKSSLDQQVQDLVALAEESTSGKGVVTSYEGALSAVSRTQAQTRSLYAKMIAEDPGNRKNLTRSEHKLLGQESIDRQSAISGLLGYYQSVTQVQASKDTGIGPAADLERAERTLEGLRNQLAQAHKIGADATTLNQLQQQINQQIQTVLQDRVTYYQQMSQALTQYEQGSTADPVQQQQIAINNLQQLYQQMVSSGDTNKADLLNTLGQIRSAILQKISDQITIEQAQQQQGLAQMNIGQPQGVQLQNAVAVAQRELSYLDSLPKSQVNPQTLIQAQTALFQAQGALVQYQIQQGEQLIQAEASLMQGETFDPVAIANAALEGARKLLAYDTAHHMSQATLTQDAAGVAQAFKSQQQAQWQKSEATTEFLASTYQITGAQEIQQLQKLMATMKKAHASYSDIQQVAQELWNLEYGNTGTLNLNTGAIHLPSTYEVKSAIRGAGLAARRTTTAGLVADIKNAIQMNITINRDVDMRKVVKGFQDALGVSIDGLGQAVGMV